MPAGQMLGPLASQNWSSATGCTSPRATACAKHAGLLCPAGCNVTLNWLQWPRSSQFQLQYCQFFLVVYALLASISAVIFCVSQSLQADCMEIGQKNSAQKWNGRQETHTHVRCLFSCFLFRFCALFCFLQDYEPTSLSIHLSMEIVFKRLKFSGQLAFNEPNSYFVFVAPLKEQECVKLCTYSLGQPRGHLPSFQSSTEPWPFGR